MAKHSATMRNAVARVHARAFRLGMLPTVVIRSSSRTHTERARTVAARFRARAACLTRWVAAHHACRGVCVLGEECRNHWGDERELHAAANEVATLFAIRTMDIRRRRRADPLRSWVMVGWCVGFVHYSRPEALLRTPPRRVSDRRRARSTSTDYYRPIYECVWPTWCVVIR